MTHTHCLWCGVYLQGGATVHRPECWIADLMRRPELPLAALETIANKFQCEGWEFIDAPAETVPTIDLADECACRTCGHRASAHVTDGHCLECGQIDCWS